MTQEEKQINVEAANERLAHILPNGHAPSPMETMMRPANNTEPTTLRIRKKRSDAGVPKGPKTPPANGALTVQQRRELESRISSMIRTREAMEKAIAESDKAQKYYEDYLDSLTNGQH